MKSSINATCGLSFKDAQDRRVTMAEANLSRANKEMAKAIKDGCEKEALEEHKSNVKSCRADVAGAKGARDAGNRFPPLRAGY